LTRLWQLRQLKGLGKNFQPFRKCGEDQLKFSKIAELNAFGVSFSEKVTYHDIFLSSFFI